MVNIIGISLGFIGSVISVLHIIFKRPTEKFTYRDLGDMGKNEVKGKNYTMFGLCFIAFGFLFQFISEVIKL